MIRDALIAYLLGSIPWGLLITRLAGLGDIRHMGSGNIGATNVLRTGHKGLATLTLLLDALKGVVAVLVARDHPEAGALFAVIGHMFPVWLSFRGGKGVATGLGVMLTLAFPVGLAACSIWLGVAIWKKYSSVAALTAFASSPMTALIFGEGWAVVICALLIAALVFYKHRANIERLLRGEEPQINLWS